MRRASELRVLRRIRFRSRESRQRDATARDASCEPPARAITRAQEALAHRRRGAFFSTTSVGTSSASMPFTPFTFTPLTFSYVVEPK
jgi:hypothetical protein